MKTIVKTKRNYSWIVSKNQPLDLEITDDRLYQLAGSEYEANQFDDTIERKQSHHCKIKNNKKKSENCQIKFL